MTNLQKEQKLLYIYYNRNLNKCLLTPFKNLDKNINNNFTLNIKGKDIQLLSYFIQDKIFLPIRPIAEAFNYNLKWDNFSKNVILEKDNNIIKINTNYENFIKDGIAYVSKNFIENTLNIAIQSKKFIIYIR